MISNLRRISHFEAVYLLVLHTLSGINPRNGNLLDLIEVGLVLGRYFLFVLTHGITKFPPCLGSLIFILAVCSRSLASLARCQTFDMAVSQKHRQTKIMRRRVVIYAETMPVCRPGSVVHLRASLSRLLTS
jgi:hypothetical protein